MQSLFARAIIPSTARGSSVCFYLVIEIRSARVFPRLFSNEAKAYQNYLSDDEQDLVTFLAT